MSVAINSTRKTVEISWDPAGSGSEPNPPEGFPEHPIVLPPEGGGKPEHPIYLPPYIDNSLPGDQPYPDQGLPGNQPRPDQSLPGDQPYPDQGLPGDQPIVDAGFPADQPEVDNELPEGDQNPIGNLPPAVQPVHADGQALAVQVFAQGQEGDWSNTAVMPNDGLAALVYPQNFTGESYVEVRALDGALIDSGTINVT